MGETKGVGNLVLEFGIMIMQLGFFGQSNAIPFPRVYDCFFFLVLALAVMSIYPLQYTKKQQFGNTNT